VRVIIYVFLGLVLIGLIYFSKSFFYPNKSPVGEFYGNGTPTYGVNRQFSTIVLGGDVMLGRSVMQASINANDFRYPFLRIQPYLSEADIVFVNLENPIITACPRHNSGFVFCSPRESLESLVYAGVDIVNLANNHISNYGIEGIKSTVDALSGAGIIPVGLGELGVKDVQGVRFGFLGFDKSQETRPNLSEEERKLIVSSSNLVDFLIVGVHWGLEYQDKPLDGVVALGREIISLGADVVSGHHPHWVQGVDCWDGLRWSYIPSQQIQTSGFLSPKCKGVIFYSLGNLVFDQMWSEETRKGIIAKLKFGREGIDDIVLYNTYIRDIGQPDIF
jgi:poly-gamma-glutamate synthesis protein (capsule biosynthesis protein)